MRNTGCRRLSWMPATGFTLIELMVAVAIAAILAAIAYPSYTAFVLRTNRAAAQAEMMHIASLEQQFFLANKSYFAATNLADPGIYQLSSQVSERYGCKVETTDTPSFTLTCRPKGPQSGDGDLEIRSDGTRTRDGSASKW